MFLAEIDPSQLDVLSVSSTTDSLVQLSAGGSAILSAPSAPLLSGKLLKLIVTGLVQITSGGSNPNVTIYLGTSTSSPILSTTGGIGLGSDSGSGSLLSNFAIEYDFSWSSVAEQTVQASSSGFPAGTIVSSIATQSAIEFCIGSAKGNFGDTNFSLTITSFKLKKV